MSLAVLKKFWKQFTKMLYYSRSKWDFSLQWCGLFNIEKTFWPTKNLALKLAHVIPPYTMGSSFSSSECRKVDDLLTAGCSCTNTERESSELPSVNYLHWYYQSPWRCVLCSLERIWPSDPINCWWWCLCCTGKPSAKIHFDFCGTFQTIIKVLQNSVVHNCA